MRRIRVERKAGRARDDRAPILPLDPRDQDVLRAKLRSLVTRARP